MLKHGLKSQQYDFVNAFVQAPLRKGEELYMYLPPGYREDLRETHVCKLQKSLYGLQQGSINWYLHLQEGLRKRGFRQSELDPGIYFSPTLVLITHVDYEKVGANDVVRGLPWA